MASDSNTTRLTDIVSTVAGALDPLDPADRARVLRSVGAVLDIGGFSPDAGFDDDGQDSDDDTSGGGTGSASTRRRVQPLGDIRSFLAAKAPESAIEQLACLAYFKEKSEGVPQYKAKDLTKLNHDAGGARIGNPSQAMGNAKAAGFLVAVSGGNSKLSILGERVVEAMPDRDAVKKARASSRGRTPRKAARTRKAAKKTTAKKR